MNGFDLARGVEARAMARLIPFLEEHSDSGRFVVTAKGRLAPFLQEVVGDVLVERSGSIWSIELKAEAKERSNFFLETWSNKNLDDPDSHAMRGSNPGWMFKLRADLLFYYFLDTDVLYAINFLALKRWAFGWNGNPAHLFDAEWKERPQAKYSQCNDTWGRCVSIDHLSRVLTPPPKRLFVRQLELALRDAAA